MGRFEIFRDKKREFRFRLRAGNGEIILASEGYKAKVSCANGVKSVKTNSPDDGRIICHSTSSDEFYFTVKAANGKIIGVSETYCSFDGMENGIESVQANAPISEIVDLS